MMGKYFDIPTEPKVKGIGFADGIAVVRCIKIYRRVFFKIC